MIRNTSLFASLWVPSFFLAGCSGGDPSADISASSPLAIPGEGGSVLQDAAGVTPETDAGAGTWKTESTIYYGTLGGDRAPCPSGQVQTGQGCVPVPSPSHHRACTPQMRCSRG